MVALSTEDDDKLLEQLKTGFKRTIKWNKYRSKVTNQVKTSNLNQRLIKSIDYFIIVIDYKSVDWSLENKDDRYLFRSVIHKVLK